MWWVEKGRSRSIRGDGPAIWIRDAPMSRLTFWRPAPVQRGLDRPWTSLHNPALSYLPGPSSIVRLPARAQGRVGLRRSRPSNSFEAANQGGPGDPEVPAYSCLACAGRTARKRPDRSPPTSDPPAIRIWRHSGRYRAYSPSPRATNSSLDRRGPLSRRLLPIVRRSSFGPGGRQVRLADEAPRVSRRHVRLSHAAIEDCSCAA